MNIHFFNGWGVSEGFEYQIIQALQGLIIGYSNNDKTNLNIGIGWSLGSFQCLQYHEHNPFDALILLSFTPCFVQKNQLIDNNNSSTYSLSWGMSFDEFSFFEQLFDENPEKCLQHFQRLVLFPKMKAQKIDDKNNKNGNHNSFLHELSLSFINQFDSSSITKLKKGLETLKNWNMSFEQLQEIQSKVPLLWIHGEYDQLMKMPVKQIQKLNHTNQSIHYKEISSLNNDLKILNTLNIKIIAKTGHHLLENPQTWQEICGFIKKIDQQ